MLSFYFAFKIFTIFAIIVIGFQFRPIPKLLIASAICLDFVTLLCEFSKNYEILQPHLIVLFLFAFFIICSVVFYSFKDLKKLFTKI